MALPIIDSILGIGRTLVDRLVKDKNKEADQLHESKNKQADATIAGESNSSWTPRKILMMAFGIPAMLQFVLKPVVEWVAVVIGRPVTLPGIDVGPSLELLIGLLGLSI